MLDTNHYGMPVGVSSLEGSNRFPRVGNRSSVGVTSDSQELNHVPVVRDSITRDDLDRARELVGCCSSQMAPIIELVVIRDRLVSASLDSEMSSIEMDLAAVLAASGTHQRELMTKVVQETGCLISLMENLSQWGYVRSSQLSEIQSKLIELRGIFLDVEY